MQVRQLEEPEYTIKPSPELLTEIGEGFLYLMYDINLL